MSLAVTSACPHRVASLTLEESGPMALCQRASRCDWQLPIGREEEVLQFRPDPRLSVPPSLAAPLASASPS